MTKMAGNLLGLIFELVLVGLSVGMTYFVSFIGKAFKGGVMEALFKFLSYSMALLTAALVAQLTGLFLPVPAVATLESIGIIGFFVCGYIGFHKLYTFWRFDFVGKVKKMQSSILAQSAETSSQ